MRLSSQVIGAGAKPTILLHGFLGSGKNLRTLAQRWSDRDPTRVFLLPDLRGHGSSPPADERTDLRAMARDVIDTARAEELKAPLEVVGHSLGGRVGLAGSLVAPAEISRVTFLDITPGPIASGRSESGRVLEVLLQAPEEAADRRQLRAAVMDRGLSPALADWLMMNVVQESGSYRWRFDRQSLARLHERVNSEDLWEAVERAARANVRCIRGGASPYVSPADMERMQRAGCRVDTLPNAGHFVHVDALEPLLDFLAQE